jgi:hypothetical protein
MHKGLVGPGACQAPVKLLLSRSLRRAAAGADAGVSGGGEGAQRHFEDSAVGYDAVAEFQATLAAEFDEVAAGLEDDGGADWGGNVDDSDGEQPACGPGAGPVGEQVGEGAGCWASGQGALQRRAARRWCRGAGGVAGSRRVLRAVLALQAPAASDWLSQLASGNGDVSAAWQGKGTWRFKGAAAAAKASKLQAARAARAGRTAGRALDFEAPPARPEFRPASRKATCLGRRVRPKRARAPPAAAYDVGPPRRRCCCPCPCCLLHDCPGLPEVRALCAAAGGSGGLGAAACCSPAASPPAGGRPERPAFLLPPL